MKRSWWIAAVVAMCLLAGACSRSNSSKPTTATPTTTAPSNNAAATSTTAASKCNTTLQATDIGITPTTITVEVMADVGSPLAPGLFQGNLDALNAFATVVNNNGGLACRKLVVKTWDSKLDPTESKNGLIDACQNAFAMVGNNALFNPDMSPATGCVDKNGQATGLPDVVALANDINELCAPVTFDVQNNPERCPIASGPRPEIVSVGAVKWYEQKFGTGLHGIYMVPGDLPTTVQSATYNIDAQAQAGITWDAVLKVSGLDAQPAYTPRVQIAKAKGSTYVYDGSNDVAMIRMRKESAAQGLSTIKVWSCSIACYTKAFLSQGGSDVEGTYLFMNSLPFEEASTNPADQAYVTALGSKVDSFGANGWQAALAFQQAVNTIVDKNGPNALTRASLLTALKGITNFSAGGWIGPKALQGPGSYSPCYLIMQVQNGKYVRVYPTQPGTMDCNPSNLVTLNVDPVTEGAKIK